MHRAAGWPRQPHDLLGSQAAAAPETAPRWNLLSGNLAMPAWGGDVSVHGALGWALRGGYLVLVSV